MLSLPSIGLLKLWRLGTGVLGFSIFGSALWAASIEQGDPTGPLFTSFREEMAKVLDEYCYDCHGFGTSKGGVTLDEFSDDQALQDHALWLRVLKNVRGGIMPPAGEFQPEEHERGAMVDWIKSKAFELDATHPDPGRVRVRRLNRVEYRNSVRDLLGVDYDTAEEFPADDAGHGFDNIADVLTISPMLLEKYLDAAQAIIDEAIPLQPRQVEERWVSGARFKSTVEIVPVPETTKLAESVGEAVPTEYTPSVESEPLPSAQIWQAGVVSGNDLDLLYYSPASVATTTTLRHDGDYEIELNVQSVERYVDNQFDLNRCRLVFKLNDEILLEKEMVREGYRKFNYVYPQTLTAGDYKLVVEIYPLEPAEEQKRQLRVRLDSVIVRGPMAREHWTMVPDYADFFPRPVPADATYRRAYAREILGNFATRAFRRPVDAATLDRLVEISQDVAGRDGGTFESGVAQAMVGVMASSRFLFREEETLPLGPGETYPLIDEYALASRLSYFLWSTMPDQELFQLAEVGELRDQLSTQVARMLRDPKSGEFVENFVGQWLQVRDITNVEISSTEVYLRENPSPEVSAAFKAYRRMSRVRESERTPEQVEELAALRKTVVAFYRLPKPDLSRDLKRAMGQETRRYFDHILREDRSVLELLDSNYTFLNEDLAEHYGIDHVEIKGDELRKVILPGGSPRGGVLTQGTVLAVTSNPTRTSPVKRGVFILDHILGLPPPPPPPNIPSLEDAVGEGELAQLSLRETLALHASDPVCSSCHMRMDPLGLALENFNAMGRWRDAEMGQPIEPHGQLISGESFATIQELKKILVTSQREQFLHTLSEKMLIYALGRGMEYYDVETLDQLVAQLEAADGRPSALISGIIESAPFQRTRRPDSALAQSADHWNSSTDQQIAHLDPTDHE